MDYFDRDGNPMPDNWYSKDSGYRATWFATSKRVGSTVVGDVRVSTVWLGLDHSFTEGVPIIFETMVFGGDHDQNMTRYATEERAMRGHLAVVDRLRAGLPPFEDGDDA